MCSTYPKTITICALYVSAFTNIMLRTHCKTANKIRCFATTTVNLLCTQTPTHRIITVNAKPCTQNRTKQTKPKKHKPQHTTNPDKPFCGSHSACCSGIGCHVRACVREIRDGRRVERRQWPITGGLSRVSFRLERSHNTQAYPTTHARKVRSKLVEHNKKPTSNTQKEFIGSARARTIADALLHAHAHRSAPMWE